MSAGRALGPAPTSPTAFGAAVIAHLTTSETVAEETLKLVLPVIEGFATYMEQGLGISDVDAIGPDDAERFMASRQADGSPPTYAARRIRRMGIRLAFRTGRALGLAHGDPSLDIDLGPPASIHARPLTDEEIERGRSFALPSLRDKRRSIAWALAEATAPTSEMGLVRVGDVETSSGRVWLSGSAGTEPRWGRFSEWGSAQVERRLQAAEEPSESLIVWRSEPKTLRAACSQAITETLKAAGFHGDEVKPRSIVAWAGRQMLDEGSPIDEVARRFGMRSLDQTAGFVRFDWREETG
jgi:hypothetical protein